MFCIRPRLDTSIPNNIKRDYNEKNISGILYGKYKVDSRLETHSRLYNV